MAKRKEKKPTKARTRPRAKAQSLPGMTDRGIPALDECGEEYAEIRDQRMELTEREHALKTHIRTLMKKHNRTHYQNSEWEISLIPTEDDVKVKRLKPEDIDEAEDDAPDVDAEDEAGDEDAPADVDDEVTQTEERRAAVDGDTGE